jgi:ABC-2 type transport system ATP-binding protein
MDEAERCHRLAYMAIGKIFASGTKDEVVKQSGLVTWQVTDSTLGDLVQQLKGLPGIEQITPFGKTVHISGKNTDLLEKSLAPFMQLDQLKWQKITPNMEDVFISLVGAYHEPTTK